MDLLSSRKIRNKLPQHKKNTAPSNIQENVAEIDTAAKEKLKHYADKHRSAKEGTIEIGATVLVKQTKVNKFLTRFNPTLYQIVRRNGTVLTAKSVHGHYITRNIWLSRK